MKRPALTKKVVENTEIISLSTDGEIPVIRWSNRRRMAWRAFTCFVIGTMLFWFALPLWFQWFTLPTSWLTIIGDSYFWFATGMIAIIIGYMGFTTLPFWGAGTSIRNSGVDTSPNKVNQVELYSDDY